MTEVVFTVHGVAQPAGSKRGFVNQRTGHVIVTDANRRSRPWKSQVTDAAAEAMNGAEMLRGPLSLSLTFVVPRPKGHFGKRGVLPSAPVWPAVRPDLLKLARAVEDSLTGVCYGDDAQIVREQLVKEYGEPARTVVALTPITAAAVEAVNAA